MADTNELIDVCTDLIRLVEGVGCKDWRDQDGNRFKDTNEWVRAYVAINNARKESREQATPPADAALADDLDAMTVCDSNRLDVFQKRKLHSAAAALRARAVPEGFVLVPVEPTPRMVDATWDHEIDRDGGIESQNKRNRRIYAAMLAASKEAK